MDSWRRRAGTMLLLLAMMGLESACETERPSAFPDPAPGISDRLAAERAEFIENVRYNLAVAIPSSLSEPVTGRVTVRFTAREGGRPVVLDFAPGQASIMFLAVGSKPSAYRAVNGHIVIPGDEIFAGENVVDIAFRAGEAALNRNEDFLYTLFVPARAHLAFPCFDQPDLKGRFTLELTMPAGWEAVANGAEWSREAAAGGKIHSLYHETEPISTYLFAFAAGKFEVERAERNGRTFRMLHRETDGAKVARNRDALFDLHASSLEWLETYTGIAYRFGKFDFVLVPSFQFTGMEHPGAIYYNSASLLLDESATQNQMLARASVIAHETSHMWFGDLVTMRWFNDVWTKEVFANFMAAKIVNPAFPEVDHELRFLVAHYPQAYSVDRTGGTHAIRQPLANLNDAGTLYGPIIYQKAPIVMRQLERLIGAERMQSGLRTYLERFQFRNATWPDLVQILDERTPLDLTAWSHTWIEEAARPSIGTELGAGSDTGLRRLEFVQRDPQPGRSLVWTQQMQVLVGTTGNMQSIPVEFNGPRVAVDVSSIPRIDFVLPTGGGLAYGEFVLDDASRAFLLRHAAELPDAVSRGAAWVTLWDEMLAGRVRPTAFVDAVLRALPSEQVEQNVQLVTSYLTRAFWQFLPPSERAARAAGVEAMLRAGIQRSMSSSSKSTYFTAFYSVVTTPPGLAFLERVWRRQERIPGLTLAEQDEATMALELAVRGIPSAAAVLEDQLARFQNPDRKARFAFVMPAVSNQTGERDSFFASLSDVANRRREPWVVEGLRYLNHPLRAEESLKYLPTALTLLRQIQQTGDIFFPKNWMDAALFGHRTREAADIVRGFLAAERDYPLRLQRIVLQSADDLLRASTASPQS